MKRAALLLLALWPAAVCAAEQEPVVGAELQVAEGDLAARPRAAFASAAGVYLAVWQDGWPGLGATADVFGVRLKPGTLEPLDKEPLKIGAGPEAQSEPAVAAADDLFLVVWQDFRNGRDLDVRGALVDAKTGQVRGGEIEIAGRPKNQARPAAAWT